MQRSSLGPRGQRPGEHRAISAGHSAEKDPKEVDQVDQVDHVSICFIDLMLDMPESC